MLRQHRFEADRGGDLLRIVAGIGAEHLLVARVAGAEHDELQVQPHQSPHDVGDQVEALLVVEPRDHADHGDGGVLRQADLLLQRQFVFDLLLDAPGVVTGRQGGVAGRVEDVVIDAVDDPAQFAAKDPQQGVHLLAVLGGQDLFRVAIAHGIDNVREKQPAPEQVDDVVQP